MSTVHSCPKPGCLAEVQQDKLACPTHWYELPAALRARINRAWRNHDFRNHRLAVAAALQFWREGSPTAQYRRDLP